ncbi:hypothetical protein THIX_60359 [Thiomonas sp. X19]|nr:hypothetical protein THIX_60359 [Thiomonas sp. X19]
MRDPGASSTIRSRTGGRRCHARLIAACRNGSGQGTTTATGSAPELRGTEFDLVVAESPVNFTGSPRMATTINGSIPAPTCAGAKAMPSRFG